MNWHISRRMMLRGVGAAVSLPLLDVMSTRASGESSPPIRLAYLYIPNGVAEGAWQPEEVDKRGKAHRRSHRSSWSRSID